MMKQTLRALAAAAFLVLGAAFTASAQEVKVIKFNGLQQLRQQPHDTLYVVNFWATWCKPCIKEMPYFEAVNEKYKNRPVRVILVSMDAVEDLDKRVKPFIQRRGIKSDVMLLDEVDGNTWIDRLEPKWSGSIPATIVFNNKRKQYEFKEGEMTQEELNSLIDKML